MRGAVFLGNRKVELRSFPDPTPGPLVETKGWVGGYVIDCRMERFEQPWLQ